MTTKPRKLADTRPPAPRIALTIDEAAQSLGLGRTFFTSAVLPRLRILYIRGERRVPVSEIERYVSENTTQPGGAS